MLYDSLVESQNRDEAIINLMLIKEMIIEQKVEGGIRR